MRTLTLGVLIGTFLLQRQPSLPALDPIAWLAAGLALLIPALWLAPPGAARADARRTIGLDAAVLVLLAAAGAMLGFGHAQWRAESRLADQFPPQWEGRDIELVGNIDGLPVASERGTRFEFEVDTILTAGAIVPGHLSLTWYKETVQRGTADEASIPAPAIRPGERWQLRVRLRRPHGTQNPHGYDFEASALERNIRATGYVRTAGNNLRLADSAGGLGARIDRLRLVIRERMNRVLADAPYRGVLVALAIGEQNAIPAGQWQVFWRTGVGHLMSISGLHITMVASLLYWLSFRAWARIPRLALRLPAQRAAVLAGALAALGYALIAGFSVPTQRTLFMLSAVAVALWMGRSSSPSRLLCWALLCVILIDPWAVLAPGFWLSFAAVAAIFYVSSHRLGNVSALRGAVRTQLAVTLGLLPITLVLFQEVSLVSPLANAFSIPLISLVVVPLTLLGAVLPVDGLLQLAQQLMAACYFALQWLATTPNAVWQSHAPAPWTVLLALAGCAWLLLPRGVGARSFGVAMLLPMLLLLPPRPLPGELWLTLLDVGQGLAVVVRTSDHALVYDSGPSFNPDSDAGSRIVVPYLRGEGIRALDALVITHDDDDHSGGAHSIIAARDPQWILTSLDPARTILTGAREVLRCDDRDRWQWDGVDFAVLHPHPDNYAEARRKTNDLGCVLRIRAPGGSILLTADIERRSEAELLARIAADSDTFNADVLLVPHHGSKTSSSDALLDAVRPRLALVAVGYRNRFHHPNGVVMARYAARGIEVLRSDQSGAITLKFAADAAGVPAISGYRQTQRRYWLDAPTAAENTD